MRATQVEGMLPSEYLPLWREYVTAFGELLEPALRDPSFPAAQRLVRSRHVHSHVCIHRDKIVPNMHAASVPLRCQLPVREHHHQLPPLNNHSALPICLLAESGKARPAGSAGARGAVPGGDGAAGGARRRRAGGPDGGRRGADPGAILGPNRLPGHAASVAGAGAHVPLCL